MSYTGSELVTFSIATNAEELDQLQAALAAAPQTTDAELRAFMTGLVAHMQREVVLRTPTSGHGHLRNSIIGNVQDIPGGIGIEGLIGSTSIYCAAVELGSKPHMPPVEPLIDWASQKFGLTGKDAEKVGWAVAMSIKQHGTEPVEMFADALKENAGQINEQFSAVVARIVAQLGQVNE